MTWTILSFCGGKMKNQHKKSLNIGSSIDVVISEEETGVATKRIIAVQISEGMSSLKLNKSTMARKMHTSRASLNRLLDAEDTSLTLLTLMSAAAALGKKVRIELEAV
jgi:uncharacterized protein YhbP (UPF0306 family)